MTRYIINYDLSKHGRQDYYALRKRLGSYHECIALTQSCYAVVTDLSYTELRDDLLEVMSGPDKLHVTAAGASAWYGLTKAATARLKTPPVVKLKPRHKRHGTSRKIA